MSQAPTSKDGAYPGGKKPLKGIDLSDQYLFEGEVGAMCIELITRFGSLGAVRQHYEDPFGEFNQLIHSICFAQKMHADNPFLADVLARVRCVVMTVLVINPGIFSCSVMPAFHVTCHFSF